MEHDVYPDSYIRSILTTTKSIAMVGVSANESRPSYFAYKYLLERRYRMIPVNPGLAGKELLGQRVYARLADIPEPVDMVDIFRAARYALPIDFAFVRAPRLPGLQVHADLRFGDKVTVAGRRPVYLSDHLGVELRVAWDGPAPAAA